MVRSNGNIKVKLFPNQVSSRRTSEDAQLEVLTIKKVEQEEKECGCFHEQEEPATLLAAQDVYKHLWSYKHPCLCSLVDNFSTHISIWSYKLIIIDSRVVYACVQYQDTHPYVFPAQICGNITTRMCCGDLSARYIYLTEVHAPNSYCNESTHGLPVFG